MPIITTNVKRYSTLSGSNGNGTLFFYDISDLDVHDVHKIVSITHEGVEGSIQFNDTHFPWHYITRIQVLYPEVFSNEALYTSSEITFYTKGNSQYFITNQLIENQYALMPPLSSTFPAFNLKDYDYVTPLDCPDYKWIQGGNYSAGWGKKAQPEALKPVPFAEKSSVVFPCTCNISTNPDYPINYRQYHPTLEDSDNPYSSIQKSAGWKFTSYTDDFECTHMNFMRNTNRDVSLEIHKTKTGFMLKSSTGEELESVQTSSELLLIELQAGGGSGGRGGYEGGGNSSCGGGGGGGSGAYASFFIKLSESPTEPLTIKCLKEGKTLYVGHGDTLELTVYQGENGSNAYLKEDDNYYGGSGGRGGTVEGEFEGEDVVLIATYSGNVGGTGGTGYDESGKLQNRGGAGQPSIPTEGYILFKDIDTTDSYTLPPFYPRTVTYGQFFSDARKEYSDLDNDNVFGGGGGGASSPIHTASSWSSQKDNHTYAPVGCGGFGCSGHYYAYKADRLSEYQYGGPFSIWIHFRAKE